MGLCFSKKRQEKAPSPLLAQQASAMADTKPKKPAVVVKAKAAMVVEEKKEEVRAAVVVAKGPAGLCRCGRRAAPRGRWTPS
jgi:hypothetical protein